MGSAGCMGSRFRCSDNGLHFFILSARLGHGHPSRALSLTNSEQYEIALRKTKKKKRWAPANVANLGASPRRGVAFRPRMRELTAGRHCWTINRDAEDIERSDTGCG